MRAPEQCVFLGAVECLVMQYENCARGAHVRCDVPLPSAGGARGRHCCGAALYANAHYLPLLECFDSALMRSVGATDRQTGANGPCGCCVCAAQPCERLHNDRLGFSCAFGPSAA